MKKVFTFFIASAIALSASAEINSASGSPVANGKASLVSSRITPGQSFSVKKIRKADAKSSVEGTWIFTLGDIYRGDDSYGTIEAVFQASFENSTVVAFEDPYLLNWPFFATYNESARTLTVKDEMIGTVEGGDYAFQQPFVWNNSTNDLDPMPLVGTVTPDFSEIVFDTTEEHGISWAIYGDQMGTIFKEYIAAFAFSGANRLEPLENDGWTTLDGKGKLIDGWVLPGLGIDQFANEYQVTIQQSTVNENLYRILNPYKEGPAAKYNECEDDGCILFDITDPKHVWFPRSYAGFANTSGDAQTDISLFYSFNQLGFYMENYPDFSMQDIIDINGDYMVFSTYDNGVIKLMDHFVQSNGFKFYDTNFGYQWGPYGGYCWGRVNMGSRILMPGVDAVDTIDAEAAAAPEVYYNLQGVRVENPRSGEIVIVRKGAEAYKQVVR